MNTGTEHFKCHSVVLLSLFSNKKVAILYHTTIFLKQKINHKIHYLEKTLVSQCTGSILEIWIAIQMNKGWTSFDTCEECNESVVNTRKYLEPEHLISPKYC